MKTRSAGLHALSLPLALASGGLNSSSIGMRISDINYFRSARFASALVIDRPVTRATGGALGANTT